MRDVGSFALEGFGFRGTGEHTNVHGMRHLEIAVLSGHAVQTQLQLTLELHRVGQSQDNKVLHLLPVEDQLDLRVRVIPRDSRNLRNAHSIECRQ